MRVTIRGQPESVELLRKALGAIPSGLTRLNRITVDLLGREIDRLDSRMQQHLQEWIGGERSRSNVEYWLKREIREAYDQAYYLGKVAGGRDQGPLDAWDQRALRKERYFQYRYLRGFLDDVAAGRGRMDYGKRMRMYADSTSGPYWMGFVMANRSNKRRITWQTTPAEHCETCIELDGKTWTPRAFVRWYQQNHILPGVGTKCLSNCKCFLKESYA